MDSFFGHIFLNEATVSRIWKLPIHTSTSVQLHFSDLCLNSLFSNHVVNFTKFLVKIITFWKKYPFKIEIIYIILNKSK